MTAESSVAPATTNIVASAIADVATRFPSVIAIETPDAAIDYAALIARADSLAKTMRGAALVAVCLPRSIDQLVALLAAWRAGAAYLPLDPAWPDARIAALVARAGADIVVADREPGQRIAGRATLIDPREVQPGAVPAGAASAADLAYVIFTSGSTGEPKAVEITHRNLAALVAWHRDAFRVGAGTRTSHIAGLGFDAAAWEVWPTLAAGGTLVLADDATRVDAPRLRDWLVDKRIDVAFAPTALAEPLVGMDWPAATALRVLLTGADKLTRRPAAGLPFAFVNNYGPTESTVVATSGVVPAEGSGLPTIGKAVAGTQIHLLDPAGEPVAVGTPGELFIAGAQVGRGYRGDAALTQMRFVDHPRFGRLYRTGDLAQQTESGDYAFLGRIDNQVKVRGHRVEPAEVAAALHLLPGVAQSVVVARDGDLVAYVVSNDADLTATALRRALAETLPDYMVPARFATLDALPMTANGKVDVAALPDPGNCAMAEAVVGRAAATPTEERLFAIIADVIGRRDFGVEDDFFLLGGHSLLATQVIVRARDAFGVDLDLFHMFDGRSVAVLARTIEGLIFEKLASLSDEEIQRMSA